MKRILFAMLCLLAVGASQAAEPVATFSIVAYDPATGDLGIAVQSKFFGVGAVVPWAKAEVGAIATQAFANTTFGPEGLALLAEGLTPEKALAKLLADDEGREQRQVGMVDAKGLSAGHTGGECMDWAGHRSGENYSVQGNILAGEAVVKNMEGAFLASDGEILGERLMRAIEAGQAAGGDSRGMQSAAMLIVRKDGGYGGFNDRYCDLRVDDHESPIGELRRIFNMWQEWALILEGYTLAEKGMITEAIHLGERAVKLSPEKGEPYFHLACYFAKASLYRKAMAALENAIERDPELGLRARTDTDLKPYWEDERFLEITRAKD
jgi:uncharacterized Ntn-hydrolase superfamily protein